MLRAVKPALQNEGGHLVVSIAAALRTHPDILTDPPAKVFINCQNPVEGALPFWIVMATIFADCHVTGVHCGGSLQGAIYG